MREPHGTLQRTVLVLVALEGALAVVAMAATAHAALANAVNVDLGSRFLLWHAIASLAALYLPRPTLPIVLWQAGQLLFALTLIANGAGLSAWPDVLAPFGGTAYILGWLSLMANLWPIKDSAA